MSGRSSSPLAAFRRRLTLFAGLLLLLVWGLSIYDLWRVYAEREAAARRQTSALATALGDHVTSLLQASDAALQGLARGIRRARQAGSQDAVEELLVQQDERLGNLFAFALFDEQGRSLASSEKGFAPGRDFADRPYVKVHLQRPDAGLHVGEPLLGRTFGKRFLPVSRRIETEDGRLLGVLMTSLDAARIAEHFGRFDLGEHGAVALIHAGGKVVARWPEFEKHFGQDISAAALFRERLPHADAGAYEGVAATDGVRRLFHYRRLDGSPLVMVVAVARQDLVAGMQDDILAHAGLAAGGSLLIVFGALLLWRAQRRTAVTLESLERSERRYHGLYDSIRDGIVMRDPDGIILDCNQAYCSLLGYRREEIVGRPSRDFVPPDACDAPQLAAEAQIEERGYCDEFEKEYLHRDGHRLSVRIRAWLMRESAGQPACYWAIVRDVTAQKVSEERIRFLAQHDALTQLPNRSALDGVLRTALAAAAPLGERVAVLLIDLDNFKTINDSLGHLVGDAMLIEAAQRLRRVVRQADVVARLGGDEFGIVMPGVAHAEAVTETARQIGEVLGSAYAIDGHILHSTPSIGISVYPDDGGSGEELMRHADTAMYHAKASGKNNYQFFAQPMNIAVNQRLALENALWGAIDGGQLLLHYQPQVDMTSGRVVGLEALLRWQHPQLGMVSPADFIPLAEESGAIDPIGAWVLETACRQGREWLAAGRDCGCLAVNISARQFRSPGFVDAVAGILALTGFPAERLELEITETAVMASAESAALTMQRLRAMGIRLAIDDFGTGYSSLSYLHRFPVNRLKIDRSFVGGIPADPAVTSLVSAIIALGDALGLELLAEGVETGAQAEFLARRGCILAQGFCFHRPLPAAAAAALLSHPQMLDACA